MKKNFVQKKRSEKQRKNIYLWAILVTFLITMSASLKFSQMVGASLWNKQNRINILIGPDPLVLLSLLSSGEQLTKMILPKNAYLEVPYGYGKFILMAVPKLAVQEQKEELLPQTIEEGLAVPIDGWVLAGDFKDFNGDAKRYFSQALILTLKEKTKTDLTLWDLFRLWWHSRRVKTNHVNNLDMEKQSIWKEEELADQSIVLIPKDEDLDLLMQRFFSDPGIKKESLAIEILNGTSYPYLAQRAGRIISNIGGEIISLGNRERGGASCLVEGKKEKRDLYTVNRIKNIFGCQWREVEEGGKADVTLTVGESYWKRMNF